MDDRELCRKFGTTLEEVESDAEKYEKGELEGMEFGEPIDGRPGQKNRTLERALGVAGGPEHGRRHLLAGVLRHSGHDALDSPGKPAGSVRRQ